MIFTGNVRRPRPPDHCIAPHFLLPSVAKERSLESRRMSQPKSSDLSDDRSPTLDELEELLPRPIGEIAAFELVRSLREETSLLTKRCTSSTVGEVSKNPSERRSDVGGLPRLDQLDDLIHRPVRELTPIQFIWLLEQDIPIPTDEKKPELLTVIPDISRGPRRR